MDAWIVYIRLTAEEEIEIERFFKEYPPEEREYVSSYKEYWMALQARKVTLALDIAEVILSGKPYRETKKQFEKILKPHFPDYH